MIFLINVWQNDIQPLKQVSVVIPIKLHAELNHKYFKLMCGLAKIMVKLNDDFQNLGNVITETLCILACNYILLNGRTVIKICTCLFCGKGKKSNFLTNLPQVV